MKRKLFIVFVLSLVSFGCASIPPSVESERGHELIEQILFVYEKYDYTNFSKTLAENYYPRILSNQIEANSCKERNVSYTFSIGQITQTKKELDIVFHWNKTRYSLVTLQHQKLSGTAHFIFKNESGSWKLLKISGDNPFVN